MNERPTYKFHEVERMLKSKLQCKVKQKRRHIQYGVYNEEQLLGITYMSRNKQDVGSKLEKDMSNQLGISKEIFGALVSCEAGKQDYIDLVT